MKKTFIAMDLGYSFVKGSCFDGQGNEKLFKFQTSVVELEDTGDIPCVEWKERKFVVGEEATLFPVLKQVVNKEDTIVSFTPIFIKKAIDITGFVPDSIALSISVAEKEKEIEITDIDGNKRKGKKIELLKEQVKKVAEELGKEIQSEVFLQGVGIWFDVGMPEDCIIVDIGFRTIDVVSFRRGKMMPAPFTYGVEDAGFILLVREIKKKLKEIEGIEFSTDEVVEILEKGGEYVRRGKKRKVDVQPIAEGYIRNILDQNLSSELKELYERIGNLYLSGGGAYYVPSELAEELGIIVPEQPEYANVRGFTKILLGEHKQSGRK